MDTEHVQHVKLGARVVGAAGPVNGVFRPARLPPALDVAERIAAVVSKRTSSTTPFLLLLVPEVSGEIAVVVMVSTLSRGRNGAPKHSSRNRRALLLRL
jgi:hypothetical protein